MNVPISANPVFNPGVYSSIVPALPDYSTALALALKSAHAAVAARQPRERPLRRALGAHLAEDIVADRDQPPFDRSIMDGYALRASEAAPGARMRITGETPAGAPAAAAIGPGQAIRIATGAPLPPGADAVIRHEWTDRGEPVVTLSPERPIRPGDCVHPRGVDARSGDVVLPRGLTISPHHVAIGAAMGRTSARVRGGRPGVFVLTSGDEIVPPETPGAELLPHQVRSSNGAMLEAMVPIMGADLIELEHIADDAELTRNAVATALGACDVLVTIGGVSAGERDHFPGAFEAADVEVSLQGAAIQPGRPILVGRVRGGSALVVALPGNPVSALVTAHLFLWPVLRILAGLGEALPWRRLQLAETVRPNPRRQAFRPGVLEATGRVRIPNWEGSGDLVHTVPTVGLAALPVSDEPLEPSAAIEFLPWAWEVGRPGAQ
ncbi:MAG: molybdopterin molybdenumtransferase MoeA [Phycisphaeraceae bacterium]|nr:MAG: molybdopterin molybdenumtransferase MoeA [Phycisphaeraceae bacterium]